MLACVVLQTHEKGDQIASESITIDDYGTAQVVLTLAIMPITVYVLGKGIRDMRAQDTRNDQAANDTDDKAPPSAAKNEKGEHGEKDNTPDRTEQLYNSILIEDGEDATSLKTIAAANDKSTNVQGRQAQDGSDENSTAAPEAQPAQVARTPQMGDAQLGDAKLLGRAECGVVGPASDVEECSGRLVFGMAGPKSDVEE